MFVGIYVLENSVDVGKNIGVLYGNLVYVDVILILIFNEILVVFIL